MPVGRRIDRVGQTVLSAGDPDELAAGVLVGLRPADVDQDPGRLADDVLDAQGGDFPGSHRRGVAHEKNGAVPLADRGVSVDGRNDLAELGNG
jgi:hypothetical protein